MTKVKIPKQVAGVKIPKKVRKRAKKAVRLAENPLVRDAAVAALGAIAERKLGRAVRNLEDGGGNSPRPVRLDTERLGQTIRNAALDGLQRFLDGFEDGLKARSPEGEAAETSLGNKPRPAKKRLSDGDDQA